MRALYVAILAIAIAATVFVAGWTQILLPPSTYAVLFTKTRGYQPDVLEAGHFSWNWERLIPTNATLFMFDVQPQVFSVRSSGALPSGSDLATVLPAPADFSFDVTVAVTLAVLPEALPSLMENEGLTPDKLPEWSARYAGAVAAAARELLQRRAAAALLDLTVLEAEIADELVARFPAVELLALRFTEVRLPDLELYWHARGIYLGLLETHAEARRTAVAALASRRELALAQHQAQRDVLDTLSAYGELLEQHPVLLDLLALPAASSIVGVHVPGAGEVVAPVTLDTSP